MNDFTSRIRYKLILGKYPITKVEKVIDGFEIQIKMNEGVSIYTEVLAAEVKPQ